ncbi:MAG: hypothetical protein COB98_09550 [Flavobacteriaceae bacterium]|nr:MAG: hypothetical protein COB98_09550 [Flavobacteriaceae bacterium]
MKNYHTDSSYLITKIFYLVIQVGLVSYLIYKINDSEIIFYGGLVLISLLVFLIIRLVSKYASVSFTESNIVVLRGVSRKMELINYSNITEYQHITGFKQTSLNVIIYSPDGLSNKKLKCTTVVSSADYIDFIKWLKTKNNSIAFSFYPSDSDMNSTFKKEFQ